MTAPPLTSTVSLGQIVGGIDRHAALAKVFTQMDGDKSGSVDLAEFLGIFSAAGEKNAQRDMQLMDARGEESTAEVTKYGGFSREQKNVEGADGQLQQDEFIFHMLELLEVKTDLEFQQEIDTYLARLAEGGRALMLRKVHWRHHGATHKWLPLSHTEAHTVDAPPCRNGCPDSAVFRRVVLRASPKWTLTGPGLSIS